MSLIRKLSMRGIRNFDDDNCDKIIEFSRPLTLILGPNGTGKTTIIECLRFVLSGEFPPDSDRGKAFVHDPMLKDTRSVQIRGNVKAQILDVAQNQLTISRTIEATRMEDVVRFKTLDSCLVKVDKETGLKTSITSRCADIDVDVLSSIGASKALINYVLFCHQDDSNWPFESGKQLKERFDEIFDTTRYNKALDTIRKRVRNKSTELKILTAEQKALLIVVNEVKSKQKNLKSFETRRSECREQIELLKNKLTPINERLAELAEIEMEYCKKQLEEEKKKMEFKHTSQQIVALKKDIKELYLGSTEDLDNEIDSYEQVLREKNDEIVILEGELQCGSEKETKISKIIAEKRVTVGTFRQQIDDQTLRITKRNDILKNLMTTWKLNEHVSAELSEEDVLKLIKKIEEKLREFEQELEAKRREQDGRQEQLQRKVNSIRADRATIESQLSHKESELLQVRGEIRTNRSLLKQSGAMEEKLNDVDTKLEAANKKVKELSDKYDIDSIKRKIINAAEQEEEHERKCNVLDKEITMLRQQSELRIKLESSQAELTDKEQEIRALKNKHGDTLKMLHGKSDFPQANMTHAINEVQRILNSRVQNLKKEIDTVQYELMKLETSVKHKRQELDKKVKEIDKDKQKLAAFNCEDSTSFRENLLLQSKKVKDIEDKRGMYAYQGSAYKEYIQKLEEPESCCPLCHREFQSKRAASELISELRNDMSEHPDRLKNCERELATQRKKYDAMLQLQPLVEKIDHFKRTEMMKMQQEIEGVSKSFSDARQKVKRLQESMAEPERQLAICKNMIGDMALWDRYLSEIESIECSIEEYQSCMRNAGLESTKTITQAQTEYNNLQQLLKDIRRDMKQQQSLCDSQSEELRRATETRTKLLETQLRIHQEMQDIKQAKESLASLTIKENTLTETVRNLEGRLIVLDDLLAAAVENFEKVRLDCRGKQEMDRNTIRERGKDFDKINSMQNEILQFHSRNIQDQLKKIEEHLNSAERTAEKLKNERISRESKISKIRENIIFHDTKKRDLIDNQTLRRKEIELEKLRVACHELGEKLRTTNYTSLSVERNSLCQRRDLTERERNIAQGTERELDRSVADLTLELEKNAYKFAHPNYKKKCAEMTLCKYIIQDLHLFSQALDAAMIEYHEERMNTVNNLMSKLWGLVYKGQDTTSIQIHAHATTSGGAEKKRQFNYKLIQIKHGIEMDMRGRCSAGQKVLASIILRLALAETFCEKCGIMALDEPTTNLDEENSRALADALHTYVSARKSQKNFQLILITHDENFIPKLATLSSKNTFYELFRYDNGLSGVRKAHLGGNKLEPDDSSNED